MLMTAREVVIKSKPTKLSELMTNICRKIFLRLKINIYKNLERFIIPTFLKSEI